MGSGLLHRRAMVLASQGCQPWCTRLRVGLVLVTLFSCSDSISTGRSVKTVSPSNSCIPAPHVLTKRPFALSQLDTVNHSPSAPPTTIPGHANDPFSGLPRSRSYPPFLPRHRESFPIGLIGVPRRFRQPHPTATYPTTLGRFPRSLEKRFARQSCSGLRLVFQKEHLPNRGP